MISEAEAERRYQALLGQLAQDLPGFRLRRKGGSRGQRLIHHALRLCSLGQMGSYLTDFHTTLGRTVYVTDDFHAQPATERWATLRHEAVHLRQFAALGFVGMALVYVLLPFPIVLAYGRMRLERAAYEETLRAWYEIGGPTALRDPQLRRHICSCFLGPSYLWMWPFPRAVAAWYDQFVAQLLSETS